MRRRRPVLAAASAVAVFASVGLFAHLYTGAARQESVLVVVRPVQAGQQLTTGDLGEASASLGPGVGAVPSSAASQVLGRLATTELAAGSLLLPADVSSAPPVPAGEAVVGMALKAGQLPAAGLSPGDHVMVVQTGAPGSPLEDVSGSSSATASAQPSSSSDTADGLSDGTGAATDLGAPDTGILAPAAVVFNALPPDPQSSSDVSELVSLELASSLAPAVSAAAAAGQVSLALVPSPTSAMPPAASSGPAPSSTGVRPGPGHARARSDGRAASTTSSKAARRS